MSASHIFSEFNKARDWLLPALEDDTEDEVLNDLLLNRAQLWRGDEGVCNRPFTVVDGEEFYFPATVEFHHNKLL